MLQTISNLFYDASLFAMILNKFGREELQIHKDEFHAFKTFYLKWVNFGVYLMLRTRVLTKFVRIKFHQSTFLYQLTILNNNLKTPLKDVNFKTYPKDCKITKFSLHENLSVEDNCSIRNFLIGTVQFSVEK